MGTDEKKFRRVLDMARGCVLRGQAPQALAHLDSIRLEIDDFPGTSVWAEYMLTYAGALAAMRERGAEYSFDDAFKRISQLSEPDPALETRAHGDFGKYLLEQRSFKRAREQYRLAEKIAETLDQSDEDLAHFQMCLIGIELQEKRDPQLHAFQNLRRAAAMDGYTNVDQREAWFHYIDEFQRDSRQMIAARKGNEASVDYFRGVLSPIRRRRSEVVN
jgi:hypothetical protein